jgi:hypothetical protein
MSDLDDLGALQKPEAELAEEDIEPFAAAMDPAAPLASTSRSTCEPSRSRRTHAVR